MLLITQRYQLGHLCFIRANSEGPVEEKGGGGGKGRVAGFRGGITWLSGRTRGGLVVVDRTQKGDCRKLTANQEGSLEYERSHCLSIILQVVQNSATREARIFTT